MLSLVLTMECLLSLTNLGTALVRVSCMLCSAQGAPATVHAGAGLERERDEESNDSSDR